MRFGSDQLHLLHVHVLQKLRECLDDNILGGLFAVFFDPSVTSKCSQRTQKHRCWVFLPLLASRITRQHCLGLGRSSVGCLGALELVCFSCRQFFLLRCFLASVFFLVFAEFVLSDDEARCGAWIMASRLWRLACFTDACSSRTCWIACLGLIWVSLNLSHAILAIAILKILRCSGSSLSAVMRMLVFNRSSFGSATCHSTEHRC